MSQLRFVLNLNYNPSELADWGYECHRTLDGVKAFAEYFARGLLEELVECEDENLRERFCLDEDDRALPTISFDESSAEGFLAAVLAAQEKVEDVQ